jgi:serine/threonine-protein kinase SIK2
LCANGEAFDFVSQAGGFEDFHTRGFFAQILDGVDHFHKYGIAHRDLKLENIFLDSNIRPKVADLGLAKIFAGPNASALVTQLGTV